MGEGFKASPAADVPSQGGAPTETILSKDSRWPPRGWPMFACITKQSGTASCNERGQPVSQFLKYDLMILDDGFYALEITTGQVGKNGASYAPAIGIRFKAREDWLDEAPHRSVEDIHIRGQNLICERGAVLRVILAMTYIISRIDRGVAPNLNRVLKIYRLG
ncbi:MAG: hypothetical protein EBQ96_09720 [Proteobacteria bacterium]|nr:hypothetical protein [Pseudomonadota bacterium]